MNVPLWVGLPVVAIVALATRADVQTRKIPNLLTGTALLAGVLAHLVMGGPPAAGSALLGVLVGGGILFPGWLMGFMGAGDVKLMAAVGAWLGHPLSLMAALVSLVAGGVIAILVALQRGILRQSVDRALGLGMSLLGRGRVAPSEPAPAADRRFPFAPAILVGAIYALLKQG